MERVQDDPLKDQHSYFSDVESGRSATFSTRCYDLVRRVLLLRVFAVMVAAFFTGPFFGFHCSELPSVGFPSVGFLIIPFRVRAFHLFGPAPRSVLPRLVQTLMIKVHMNALMTYHTNVSFT